MLQRQYQRIIRWKSIESEIRGSLPLFRGERLNKRDSKRASKALTMLWLLWEGSASYVAGKHCDLPFKRWWAEVRTHDLFETLSALDAAGLALIDNADSSEFGLFDYDTFKQYLREDFAGIGALLGPIRHIIAGALGCNPVCFRISLTCLWFLKKLYVESPSLEREALEKYLKLEESLRGPVTTEERSHITRWFPKRDFPLISQLSSPHHGDGDTADAGTDLMRKYLALGTNSWLHLLCAQAHFDEFDSGHPVDMCSKTGFVPKSYKTYRTVSAEPAGLMWYQEGLSDGIRKYIQGQGVPSESVRLKGGRRFYRFEMKGRKNHPLKRRFDPSNQDFNKLQASLGSSISGCRSYCTIDLSAASDSVTLMHVKSWFRDSALYLPLMCTRSSETVLPGGDRIKLRKFAPMGSAVNFDIEVIVFCAIVESAIEEAGGHVDDSSYLVYGDDIIVENCYYDCVVDRLERNGFVVNRDKSYHRQGPHKFRESCGGFYLDGYDVTPLMISRRFPGYGDRYHPSKWVDALIDLCNRSFDRPEAKELRRYLISWVNELPSRMRPPFSFDGRRGVRSDNPTNAHLDSFWVEDWQDNVFCCGGLAPDHNGKYNPSRSCNHGPIASLGDCIGSFMLYEWLRRAEKRHGSGLPGDVVSFPVPQKSTRHNTRREDRGKGWSERIIPSFVLVD